MLRISPPFTQVQRAKSYFENGLALEGRDYYLQEHEIQGRWGGKGAKRLGLSGAVERDAFFALCDNLHPETGERLTARSKSNRRIAYDVNFGVPKSVSVAYFAKQDERILEAFRASVHETMREMEAEMQARVRKGGAFENRTVSNMLWAEFDHFTSRPVEGIADPHIHMHCFVLNAVYDDVEQRWKAGEFGDLHLNRPYFQAAFYARLAGRLNEIGYATRRTRNAFEIQGVPDGVIEKFSRRTRQIEAAAQKLGIVYPEDKAALGARTRETKNDRQTIRQLSIAWRKQLTSEERRTLAKVGSDRDGPSEPPVSPRNAMDHAISHLFVRESVVSEKKLMAEALRYGVGSVGVGDIKKEAARGGMIRRLIGGRTMVTTRAVQREERAVIAFARQGRGSCLPLGMQSLDPGGIEPHQFKRSYLNEGQRKAVEHVLQSYDRVITIRGAAGSGKTSMMQEATEALEDRGKRVFVFAPSTDASRRVLRDEGFKQAETVAHLLKNEKLHDKLRNQVIWIDEAGQLGTRDTHELFEVAQKQNARVILSGDAKQHRSVSRGDVMRVLEREAGVRPAIIDEIMRQKPADYRAAIRDLSKGTDEGVARGFEKLDRLGGIVEIADESARHEQLAKHYVATVSTAKRKGELKTALVVSPTHAEGRKVTDTIRDTLRAQGMIGKDEHSSMRLTNLSFTEAERRDAVNYEPGMVVQFLQNCKGKQLAADAYRSRKHGLVSDGYRLTEVPKGFRRSERLTVEGRDEKGNVLATQSNGSHVLVPLDQAKRFQVFRRDEVNLAVNDRVRFSQNGFTKDGKHRINNGDIRRIRKITRRGDLVLDNSWKVDRDHGHLTHGYVTTSHASQGRTVDAVYVAQGSESFPASGREQLYVSASRARENVMIWTDDKEGLRRAVDRSRERLSATELVKQGASLRMEQLKEHAQRLQRLASRARAYASQKVGEMGRQLGRTAESLTPGRRPNLKLEPER